jgi:mRNA-degrading endonuclease toxin of MazEF toxin-antitoxin module
MPLCESYLKAGVFHLQQLQPILLPRLEQKLGELTMDEFKPLKRRLASLLRRDE